MPIHVPVLPQEVLEWLQPQAGQVFIDGTLGAGGHTRLLAEKVGEQGKVIGLDRDPQAVLAAETNLRGLPICVATTSYAEFPSILAELKILHVDGLLLDLGLSSDQLADANRGFSFDAEGPLDMRFDSEQGEPAWRMLERLRADEIANLIFKYGEERMSRRVARAIVERRQESPIRTARELAELVRKCVPRGADRIDPATRTFQAIRIAVNNELGELEKCLAIAPNYLRPGGRMAIISFHSLEDRIVKDVFRNDERLRILTKKPQMATDEECNRNPRSRSAKLRVAERL